MPMAISFVGAAVIFKLIYDTRPVGQDQIGVLNAVWLAFDGGTLSSVSQGRSGALDLWFRGLMGYVIYQTLRPLFSRERRPWPIALVGCMSCAVSSQLRRCLDDLAVAWCDRLAFRSSPRCPMASRRPG
jgi:ABC-type sugar transport system permease subunit